MDVFALAQAFALLFAPLPAPHSSGGFMMSSWFGLHSNSRAAFTAPSAASSASPLHAIPQLQPSVSRSPASSSSSSSSSSSPSSSSSRPSSIARPYFRRYLATPDLLAHTSRFLSITDLLQCSSISRGLHQTFDSDRVWRRRLMRALHIQSSYVPLEIQPPYTEDDDDDDKKHVDLDDSQAFDYLHPVQAVAPAPVAVSTSPSAAPLPDLRTIAGLCRSYYAHRMNPHNYLRCSISEMAILPAPFFPAQLNTANMEEKDEGDQTDKENEQPAQRESSTPCPCFHVKMLLSRNATVNKTDCRAFALRWLPAERCWEVERMGPSFSGTLVLNVANIATGRDYPSVPSSPPTPPASSCKQRYLALLRCSADDSHHCGRLLPPTPSLPPPRPIPAWFSHHLAQLARNHEPFPPIPALPFPSFHPLPLCSQCRMSVVAALTAFGRDRREAGDEVRQLEWQVDCVVRVNRYEWDVRWREFADEITYRRCVIVPADEHDMHEHDDDDVMEDDGDERPSEDEQEAEEEEGGQDDMPGIVEDSANSNDRAEAAGTAEGSEGDNEDEGDEDWTPADALFEGNPEDEDDDLDDDEDDDDVADNDSMERAEPSPPAVPSPAPVAASAPATGWRVERVMYEHDSGVYAVNHDSNVPWTDPTPCSPFVSHPPLSLHGLHEHTLYHHQVSVYRNGAYVCDVCTVEHADARPRGVWHCPHCHFDVCDELVQQRRREAAEEAAPISPPAQPARPA